MRRRKSKVVLVDMTLEGGNVLRQLSIGDFYWFVDMEVVKSCGNRTRSFPKYFTVDKTQYPRYEDVLELIRLKFERRVS